MGRSHHDQVRPVVREARLAILRLLRRPAFAIGSDRPVFPGNGQTLRDAFDPNENSGPTRGTNNWRTATHDRRATSRGPIPGAIAAQL